MIQKTRFLTVLAVLALSIVTAACRGQAAAPATAVPTQAPATAALIDRSPLQPGIAVSPLKPVVPQTYVPVPPEQCEALRKSVSALLKVEAQTETAGFRDYASDVNGEGCLITLRGTGKNFPNFVQVSQQLQSYFEGQGWRYDQAYAADSPTGTLLGLRKDGQLALLDIGWIADASVTCPKDQPISACDIKSELQQYTITVNVAQGQ